MKKYLAITFLLLSFSGISYAQDADFGPSNYQNSVNYSNTPNPSSNSNTNSNTNGGERVRDLGSLVNFLMKYMNTFMYLVISFGVVMFVYNVIMFYVVKTDEERKAARDYVLYSVIGLFIIVSFWGLVNFVSKTLDLDNTKPNIQNLYFK